MEQVAQRGCGCPLQGGVPAYIRMLEVGDLKGLFQTKPLYDSTQAFGKETDEYNLGAADENPQGCFEVYFQKLQNLIRNIFGASFLITARNPR